MTRRPFFPDYDARLLAANVAPIFVAGALSGFVVQGWGSVLLAMVLVAGAFCWAVSRARVEPT